VPLNALLVVEVGPGFNSAVSGHQQVGGALACSGMSSVMPHPPFPNPDSQILALIISNAVGAMRSGEVDAKGAIVHAAVHAWYEGHIEGEDVCPGCDFRGDLPQQRHTMTNPDLN